MPLRGGNIIPHSIHISLNARSIPGTSVSQVSFDCDLITGAGLTHNEYYQHWGQLVMDSEEHGSFHHATNHSGGWKYEMSAARPEQSITLVTVVRVGDLAGGDNAAGLQVIRGVPADGTPAQRTGSKEIAYRLGIPQHYARSTPAVLSF